MPPIDERRGGLFRALDDGVRVAVRVQPRASRARIDGVETRGGAEVLKLRVTEAPEDGKANAAAIELLAKGWGLPKSRLAVIAGATGRDKTIRVSGAAPDLMPRLEVWLAGLERL